MRRGILLLGLACLAACSPSPRAPVSQRVVASPEPSAKVKVEVAAPDPTAEPARPTRVPAPSVAPTPAPTPAVDRIVAFRQLGSWIDVFDHDNDPATIVPLVKGMAARGVKTLYLETARFTSPTDIQFPKALGAAVDEAKAHGMRVVAWYPPAFDDLERDVRRSLVAVRYVSPKGNRFDAFAADIEYPDGVPDHAERTKRTIEYTKKLRAGAGDFPVAAIVIPPTSLETNRARWPGFPWAELKGSYDVFMPMVYWTARAKDPTTAKELTRRNAEETRRLTGKPVHVIGGLGEYADEAQVSAYVKASKESGSLGGGLYDFTTTRSEVWDELLDLN